MIEYNKTELDKAAKGIGFVRDTFEKVLRLKEILKFINTDELLKTYLALKGGTAINMTIFDLPRLSVDIDMDFTPNLSLENTRGKRSKITERIKEYMAGEGYQLSPHPRRSHSLDSFLFMYHNAVGNKDNFKIEIDYSLRAHIFSPVHRTICADIFNGQMEVQTLAPMEIFAAKVNALMNRTAARDLYDVNNMVSKSLFSKTEYGMRRKCIIFYASVSAKVINKSFDTSAIERLTFLKIKKRVIPCIEIAGSESTL